MGAVHRWSIVSASVVLLVAVLVAVHNLPVAAGGPEPATLLQRIRSSAAQGYSGYVVTRGTLDLPVTDRFTDLGALLGERTEMRVWWRDDEEWRVDKLLLTGETDLIHDSRGTLEWDYEDNQVQRSRDPAVRLPRSADLLPPVLARRMVEGVTPSELHPLGARRVAGRPAAGLRLEPGSPLASIDHVDLWAEPSSGVVLRVEVYGERDREPAFTTSFVEYSAGVPPAERTRFVPPPGTHLTFDRIVDIADFANQYAPVRPPAAVAGLEESSGSRGGVGVYGRGVTRLMVVPLRDEEAAPLRRQLRMTPGAEVVPEGVTLRVGPLGLLLTEFGRYDGGWLVAGTVTATGLVQAARDLRSWARP